MVNNRYRQQQQTYGTTSGPGMMPGMNGVGLGLFLLIAAIGAGISFGAIKMPGADASPSEWIIKFIPLGVALIFGYLIYISLRIARQWEKAVILRLGKFHAVSGPGIFFLWPIVDSISSMVDTRVQLTSFKAEQTLSRDTVPVDVDAVLFWFVWDVGKAALAVADYAQAVSLAAQTALRDTIGKTELAGLLAGRAQIEFELKKIIDERTEPWGITVQSVEMRDVLIPVALQDAMSKEAQAQRERHARVILSQAEVEVAQKFNEAAQIYVNNPAALSLRSMNMLSEAIKERGALVIVPNSAVETLGMGTITGLSSLAQSALPNAPSLIPEPRNANPPAPQPQPPTNANNGNNGQAQQRPPQNPGNPAPYSPWPNNNGGPGQI